MIRNTLASLALAFAFMVSGYNLGAPANAATCPLQNTQDNFFKIVVQKFPEVKIYRVKDEAKQRVVNYVNAQTRSEFTAEEVYLGFFEKHQTVGFAFFKDKCLVPGSAMQTSYDMYNLMVDIISLRQGELILVKQV